MNKEELQKIIATANFNSLIGQVENEWFDCKVQPYQLQDEHAKRELAKDVSSFANAKGGYIFIGIKTKLSDQHFGDEIESTSPFIQSLVDINQYRNVIHDWVYPQLEEVDVKWVEVENGKGLVIISIPEQKDTTKPFLVTKTLDGKKHVEIFFGYAQRKGDANQPLSVIDLQKSLHSGLHFEEQIKEKFEGIETLLRDTAQINQGEIQKKNNDERVKQRIDIATIHANLKEERLICISAYPNQPAKLKTIFSSEEGSIKKYLENPPTLRRAGWNLETLDQAKIMKGEMIRVVNGTRKVIDLYRDGMLIFSALGDHRFLSWHDESQQKINPVALLETIYSFVSFYELALADFEKMPEEITLRIDLKNLHLNGKFNYLSPYGLNSTYQTTNVMSKGAPENDCIIEKTFLTQDFNVGAVAFEMVREVYFWFGFEENKIPYTKTEGVLKMIDVEPIKQMG